MIHRGTYDGTIYHNPVNKFCIISVKTADKEVPQEARSTRRYRDHLIRFVATGYELPRTDAVELELDGEWTKGKYGVQLQVEQWREIVPKTKDGVEGYLASGLIKGIGPATAAQIVSRFGVETLDKGQQDDGDEDEHHRGEIVGLAPFALQCPADFLQESMNVNHHLYLQMKTAVPTGTAALQSFDCTKYSRFGFTAKGQDCANVWAILCQFFFSNDDLCKSKVRL